MRAARALPVIFLLICCTPLAVEAGPAPGSQPTAGDLARAAAECRLPNVRAYIEGVRARVAAPAPAERQDALQRQTACALKLAADVQALPAGSPWAAAPFVCYPVPAISAVRRLPDTLPPDGTIGDRLRIVAAQGEYEPASFVLFPLADVDALTLKAGDLIGTQGRIPAAAIDVKVVKCWYQAGTAWCSYFADPSRRELVPELLLNDDSLVRVDLERQENYLRVDYPGGSRYVWISYPREAGVRAFNHDLEPVQDSPALLPLTLRAGMAQQFWVTVKVPAGAAPGVYEGRIALSAGGRPAGEVRLALRVLPFELPLPMTYYDLNREFYTFMYQHAAADVHLGRTAGDVALAERNSLAEMRDMREHNLYYYLMRPDYHARTRDAFIRSLQLMKEAGFRTRPIFGGIWAFSDPNDPAQHETAKKDVSEGLAIIERMFGHRDVYCFGWDEPGRTRLLSEQTLWKFVHEQGAKIFSTGKDMHFGLVGYSEDFSNYPGWPKRENAAKWHALGQRITSYAGPHTGPENPDLARRNHGMLLYKAWYDGSANYIYYEGRDIWNDFTGGSFRNFNMVYPTRNGVIDTIAWEGFREGIDDVRYATKLKMLAQDAIATGNVDAVYTARKALLWLEQLDEESADLNAMRLEMVRYILDLNRVLEGGKR